ncbi:MAG: DUF4332 domain-containing protein [Chloroflexi bacterium]|nr:MAG: DUF4332 domain-containing protein [Chloroflexota bacterium]
MHRRGARTARCRSEGQTAPRKESLGLRPGFASGCVYSNEAGLPRIIRNAITPYPCAAVYRTLEYLRGISDDDVRRLRARGIRHTNQLLHRTSLEIDRERLSKRTGITPDRLYEFANQCTLLEVSGMDRFLPVIRRLGINSMKALRAQDPKQLHANLANAIGLAGAPSFSDVEYWISQTTALDIVEEPEPTRALQVID